jgi:hypothetical protein
MTEELKTDRQENTLCSRYDKGKTIDRGKKKNAEELEEREDTEIDIIIFLQFPMFEKNILTCK